MNEDNSNDEKLFSNLMYEKSLALESYAKKANKLLVSLQGNFERDYTSFCVGIGSLSVFSSVGLILLERSEVFSTMMLIGGFAMVIAGTMLRRFATKQKLESLPRILEFEKEYARIQQNERLYSRLWYEGKPKGLTEEQLTLLLKSNSNSELTDK